MRIQTAVVVREDLFAARHPIAPAKKSRVTPLASLKVPESSSPSENIVRALLLRLHQGMNCRPDGCSCDR